MLAARLLASWKFFCKAEAGRGRCYPRSQCRGTRGHLETGRVWMATALKFHSTGVQRRVVSLGRPGSHAEPKGHAKQGCQEQLKIQRELSVQCDSPCREETSPPALNMWCDCIVRHLAHTARMKEAPLRHSKDQTNTTAKHLRFDLEKLQGYLFIPVLHALSFPGPCAWNNGLSGYQRRKTNYPVRSMASQRLFVLSQSKFCHLLLLSQYISFTIFILLVYICCTHFCGFC